MRVICSKTEVIEDKSVTFLFVESFSSDERIAKVTEDLSDNTWVSKMSDTLKESYELRIKKTLQDFEAKVKEMKGDKLLSFIGEKIVTICSKDAIDEKLHYKKLPLGEIIKSRTSGNGGFDFYNENDIDFYVVFGEGKYVNDSNAYNKALKQIDEFIDDGKDINDLIDIKDFVQHQSAENFNKGIKSFSAGFSVYSEESKLKKITENIKCNEYFKKLIKNYNLIIVGVVFND